MIVDIKDLELRESVSLILDTFSGANGGFIGFMALLISLDKEAASGGQAAKEVTLVVVRMAKLIKLSSEKRRE